MLAPKPPCGRLWMKVIVPELRSSNSDGGVEGATAVHVHDVESCAAADDKATATASSGAGAKRVSDMETSRVGAARHRDQREHARAQRPCPSSASPLQVRYLVAAQRRRPE